MAELNTKKPSGSIGRRDFLGKLGTLIAGTLAAPQLLSAKDAPAPAEPESVPVKGPAESYPPTEFARVISLSDLAANNQSISLSDPASESAEGGKEAPILLTYDDRFNTSRIQIDNSVGIVKVDGVTCVQWTVPKQRSIVDKDNRGKSWMKDERGPHVHIAPLLADGDVDKAQIIPASVPATRAHWLHSSHVYTKSDQIEPYLRAPEYGRYHSLTPPPGQEEHLTQVDKVDITRLDYRQWSYENGAKTAYNILHWQPDQQSFQPKKENMLALNLAMLESSYKDTPGCNPYITNYAGYMGLFQFGMEALGAHKKMVSNRKWQGIDINGDTIKNNVSFLNNWQSQMAAFQYHAYSLAQQMDKSWRTNRTKKHMRGVSLVGMITAAHLKGPGAAKKYAEKGVAAGDGNGTLNSYYAHKYGVLDDSSFHHGYDISVTQDGQNVIDTMFLRENPTRKPAVKSTITTEMRELQIAKPDNLRIGSAREPSWQNKLQLRAEDIKTLQNLSPRK